MSPDRAALASFGMNPGLTPCSNRSKIARVLRNRHAIGRRACDERAAFGVARAVATGGTWGVEHVRLLRMPRTLRIPPHLGSVVTHTADHYRPTGALGHGSRVTSL